MKLIVRADDVGYTPAHNMGTFKAIDEGIVTCADVMLDCTGTREALDFLKERPWITIGWHDHMWGRPLLGAQRVPSLVNAEGRFLGRKNRVAAPERACAKYEEAYEEFSAQLELCREVTGHYPYTSESHRSYKNAFDFAAVDLAKEHHMPNYKEFMTAIDFGEVIRECKPEYAGLRIFDVRNTQEYSAGALNHDISHFEEYDMAEYMMANFDEDCLASDNTYRVVGHPGFLDDVILRESSMTLARIRDVEALTSQKLKDWIIANRVELINSYDMLNGTSLYQDHLREIDSPLWIGNF